MDLSDRFRFIRDPMSKPRKYEIRLICNMVLDIESDLTAHRAGRGKCSNSCFCHKVSNRLAELREDIF